MMLRSIFLEHIANLLHGPLWVRYKKASMYKLQVAYNDCMRLLLRQPRWCSASHLFCSFGVSTCQALLRHIRYKFISRLNLSVNSVVVMLVDPKSSDTRYQSAIWKYWYDSLLLL